MNHTRGSISADDRATLMGLSRKTLEQCLGGGELPQISEGSATLKELRASFVTLRIRDTGELRGCKGEYLAQNPLAISIINMTLSSALDDPRFPPVQDEEVPELEIGLSVLTPVQPITPDEVVVGRHRLLLRKGLNGGLFLPEVPVDWKWDRQEYLERLCEKAGLPSNAWQSDDAKLFGFESESWKEEGS